MIEIECVCILGYTKREFKVHYNWMHSDTGASTSNRFINGIKYDFQLAIL